MAKIAYTTKSFGVASIAVIEQAAAIIEEYRAAGYTLTLRQLYYQFVARAILPNTERSYKRLGSIISDARLAGLLDWEAIEDRTRNLRSRSRWDSPADLARAAAEQFHVDWWIGQEARPEVWIEKDALVGVIERACESRDVDFFACRGYVSQSEQWAAGQRMLRRFRRTDQRTVVIHLGDHDPSGVDMTRDVDDRLAMFAGGAVEVRRVALTMDQIEEFNPPPNPAKLTDSRANGYVAQHGDESWELDALSPEYLDDLVGREIDALVDNPEAMAERKALEEAGRARLERAADEMEQEDDE